MLCEQVEGATRGCTSLVDTMIKLLSRHEKPYLQSLSSETPYPYSDISAQRWPHTSNLAWTDRQGVRVNVALPRPAAQHTHPHTVARTMSQEVLACVGRRTMPNWVS